MNATHVPQRAGHEVAPSPRTRHAADDLTLAAIHTPINIADISMSTC